MRTACIIGDTGTLGTALLSALPPSVEILGISRRTQAVSSRANYRHLAFDVSCSTPDLVRLIAGKVGVPDVLIYAAGAFLDKEVADTTEEEVQRLLEIHYLAPFRILKAMLSAYRKAGVNENLANNRSIIMVSSAGIDPAAMARDDRNIAAYCAAKAALATFSVSAAREVLHEGVRLNVLAPYYFTEDPARTSLVAHRCVALARGRDTGTIVFCG